MGSGFQHTAKGFTWPAGKLNNVLQWLICQHVPTDSYATAAKT